MRPLEIAPQPILSLGRTATITANGIRYRLFRSIVTVVVVAVAVAFLMNILSESLIRRAIGERTRGRIVQLRRAAAWSADLTDPGTPEEILLRLGAAEPGDRTYREAAIMGRLSATEATAFHDGARLARRYLLFFSGLDYARRRALVHNTASTDIFDRLQDRAHMARLTEGLRVMRSVRLPGKLEEFQAFLGGWLELKERTLRVREARAAAIEAVKGKLAGRSIIEALADADGAFGQAIRDAGFALDPPVAAEVAEQARRTLEMRMLERTVATPEMRKAVAGYLDLLPGDVTVRTLWGLLRRPRSATWYLGKQREVGGEAASVPPDRAVELGRLYAEMTALSRAERLGTAAAGGFLGAGQRMGWLVIASMLVCVVGISNSMLMSVTERFREIATLKCLGALDGFIMLMFVFEAAALGIVGGIVGALLGTVLGVARMLVPFGGLALASLPAGDLLVAIGVSAVLGVVLAAVAAVYPSLKAARLAPMEAMRIQ